MLQAAAEATQGGERGELFNSAHPEDVSAGKAQVEGTVRHHMQERLDELFGRDEDLSNEDLYLKRFVGNKVLIAFCHCHVMANLLLCIISRHRISHSFGCNP